MSFEQIAKVIDKIERLEYSWDILDHVGENSQITVCTFCYSYLFHMDKEMFAIPKYMQKFENEMRLLFFDKPTELIAKTNPYYKPDVYYPKIKLYGPDSFENFVVSFIPAGENLSYYYCILNELRNNEEVLQMRACPQYFFNIKRWSNALIVACNAAYPKYLVDIAESLAS